MNATKTRERVKNTKRKKKEERRESKEYKKKKERRKKIVVVIFCGISTQLDGFENNSHLFCHLGQIQLFRKAIFVTMEKPKQIRNE